MGDGRAARLADNEALFREVNELVKEVAAEWHDPDEPIGFRCECAEADCVAKIPLRAAEYERVRSNPHWFIVVPGHENLEIERVVERIRDVLVVEKIGVGREVADETDPRS